MTEKLHKNGGEERMRMRVSKKERVGGIASVTKRFVRSSKSPVECGATSMDDFIRDARKPRERSNARANAICGRRQWLDGGSGGSDGGDGGADGGQKGSAGAV